MLLHYIGKLKNRNFALFVHVKPVFMLLCNPFNRRLSNVMKIRANIKHCEH